MDAEKDNATTGHKLIICIRHGQRSDHAGLIPVLHMKDPELTEKGKKQAFEIGKKLSEEIKSKYFSGKKIMVVSSPFARTLQTSRQIIAGLGDYENLDKKIYIDHLLCEHIDHTFEGLLPADFLSIYTNNSDFFAEEVKGVDLEFLNEKAILPVLEEDSDVYVRLGKCVENTIESLLSRDDVGIVILVSHASPIDQLNKVLGHPGPYGWKLINYCTSFVYSVGVEEKSSTFLDRLDVEIEK